MANMSYFDDCDTDLRFCILGSPTDTGRGKKYGIFDWDQRRFVEFQTMRKERDNDFILTAADEHFDDLPADVVLVKVDQDGRLISWTNKIEEDDSTIPFYARRTDFPEDTPAIHRSELAESQRLGMLVDLVAHEAEDSGALQDLVFKYHCGTMNMFGIWHEANCLLRIPAHPGIVPFHSLVIDTVDDGNEDSVDRVVGITTPYIKGGTVETNIGRSFKLKHLKQLLDTVDYLNQILGIYHGDIRPCNLLVDEDTDHIRLVDFNMGARLGWEGDVEHGGAFAYSEDRHDVKFTIFTLYEIITRDSHFRDDYKPCELTMNMVMDIKEWTAHPDVHLDAEPAEYRQILEDWVAARTANSTEITHYTQIPTALTWPLVPQYDLVWGDGAWERRGGQRRNYLVTNGQRFLTWQRPPSCQLPLVPGRKLLTTGETFVDTARMEKEVLISA